MFHEQNKYSEIFVLFRKTIFLLKRLKDKLNFLSIIHKRSILHKCYCLSIKAIKKICIRQSKIIGLQAWLSSTGHQLCKQSFYQIVVSNS